MKIIFRGSAAVAPEQLVVRSVGKFDAFQKVSGGRDSVPLWSLDCKAWDAAQAVMKAF